MQELKILADTQEFLSLNERLCCRFDVTSTKVIERYCNHLTSLCCGELTSHRGKGFYYKSI